VSSLLCTLMAGFSICPATLSPSTRVNLYFLPCFMPWCLFYALGTFSQQNLVFLQVKTLSVLWIGSFLLNQLLHLCQKNGTNFFTCRHSLSSCLYNFQSKPIPKSAAIPYSTWLGVTLFRESFAEVFVVSMLSSVPGFLFISSTHKLERLFHLSLSHILCL
jgi:hypothetical protein